MMQSRSCGLLLFLTWVAWSPPQAVAGPVRSSGFAELPDSLDELLAQAMITSPEILMARAKLQQAEAAFREARLRVTQEILLVQNERVTVEHGIHQLMQEFQQAEVLFKDGFMREEELRRVELEIIKHKNSIEQLGAQLHYLLGLDVVDPSVAATGSTDPAARPQRPPIPQKFEPHFQTKLQAQFEQTTLPEAMEYLAAIVNDQHNTPFAMIINDHLVSEEMLPPWEIELNLQLNLGTTLEGALTAIADLTGLCFVVRDYGVLVTLEPQAARLYAPTIPADVELDPGVAERGAGAVRAR